MHQLIHLNIGNICIKNVWLNTIYNDGARIRGFVSELARCKE
jgi:hypothetical protein